MESFYVYAEKVEEHLGLQADAFRDFLYVHADESLYYGGIKSIVRPLGLLVERSTNAMSARQAEVERQFCRYFLQLNPARGTIKSITIHPQTLRVVMGRRGQKLQIEADLAVGLTEVERSIRRFSGMR